MKYLTLAHFRHSFNYTIFPIHSIMQNKPNFRNDKMNITADMTNNYKILSRSPGEKTKPIQTQFNPIQSQLKPKQTQFNPIQSQTNPI